MDLDMNESLEDHASRFDDVGQAYDGDRSRDISEDILEQARGRAAEPTPTSVEFDTGRFGETEPSEPFYSRDGDGPATVGVLVAERPVAPDVERVER